jgi:salicylate biosynthesis isochorismate synthase/menaquinone-specific isochorismate synthase
MYSLNRVENNQAEMRPDQPHRYLAVSRPLTLDERELVQSCYLWHPTESLTVYWACPARKEFVWGWGVAGEGQVAVDGWERLRGKIPGPWFGGWAFDGERGWAGFPPERWVLPKVLWALRGDEAWAIGFGSFGASGLEEARERVLVRKAQLQGVRSPVVEEGDRAAWGTLIERVLTAIAAGTLEKAVAARVIKVSSDDPLDPLGIVHGLQACLPGDCRTFIWRGDEGSHFVGGSPETLCRVDGRALQTEALAGSGPLAEAQRLLNDDKELREHQVVVKHLRATLEPLCSDLDIDERPALRQLPNIAHLRTGVRATLKAGVPALWAAHALHPTPAVAGTPRDSALALLRAHEGFSRGWYAGALGWADENALELCVALRSALLTGRLAQVFVGAGVVKGSTADGEWRETQQKARPMLEALGVSV